MDKMITKILNRLASILNKPQPASPLEDDGERVDIDMTKSVDFDKFNIYQKSHYNRYKFARGYVEEGFTVADLACGTGYGTVMLSEKAKKATGLDINNHVIEEIRRRYSEKLNVEFDCKSLLHIDYENLFDLIVSFETIEHFEEREIDDIFKKFNFALKPSGNIVFSTPYMQEMTPEAIEMGFHKTFYIDEKKINKWLSDSGLVIKEIFYQNYKTHAIDKNLEEKDFIICVASKQ